MVFLDQQLNQAFAKPLPPGGPTNSGFGVNRLTLREVLLAGLAGKVHFGKTFRRFDETDDGRVVAHFADGTSADGTLLVGADGTKSAVRARVAPDAVIDDLGYAIYGKTPITPGMLGWVPEVLIDSFNRITGPEGFAVSVATCRAAEPVTDAAARLAPGVRLTEIPGYFSWTLSLTDGGFRNADGSFCGTDGGFRGADAPTLHRMASTLVRECHPAVRRIIDEADVPATFPVTIGSARPIAPWQTRSVTLLGDAIHTMSPGRGDGANIALRDAALLREALADVATNRATLADAKTRYETAMLRYGFEAVAASRDNPFLRRPPVARSAR
jgi:2-polyprenyl-6-methoxyphenol hydroxylase-like FAD-dependent oxidoreductase